VADRIAVMYGGRIVEQGAVADVVHRPMHPYTAGLLASTVGAGNKGNPLKAIPGSPPDMSNPPIGCAFALRCGYASADCLVQPSLRDVQGHAVACWHPLNQLAT
jgi:peptide/nickel transport system ATP-binding protein